MNDKDLIKECLRDLRMAKQSCEKITCGNIGHQREYTKMWIEIVKEKLEKLIKED